MKLGNIGAAGKFTLCSQPENAMAAWWHILKTAQGHAGGVWIWPAGELRARGDVGLFRGALRAPAGATHLHLYICAEGRYILWRNEEEQAVGRGPARGDLHHRGVDSYVLKIEPGQE